ncbi:hypothetical protein [uncultured Amnibacterium sp.]|uniref:hypothetical protein n=1 Tax=uncultured Amnibacterium sp. TaxID=1631851 RepID=UPI0035CC825B
MTRFLTLPSHPQDQEDAPPAPGIALVCIVVSDADPLAEMVFEIRPRYPALFVLLIDQCPGDAPEPLVDWFADHDDHIGVLRPPDAEPADAGRTDAGRTDAGRTDAGLAGLQWALDHDFDVVVQLDAAGEYHPEDIGRLLDAAERADLVLAERTCRLTRDAELSGWALPLARRLFARFVLNVPTHDPGTGLRAYHAAALRLLQSSTMEQVGTAARMELTLRAHEQGCTVREIAAGLRV